MRKEPYQSDYNSRLINVYSKPYFKRSVNEQIKVWSDCSEVHLLSILPSHICEKNAISLDSLNP